ncbi:MAG: PAS domain S-box protein [candidate division KSB1 bacterium]|nr:PAS domain S-box protein [candidate division KSB1 bacterium]
MGETHPASSDLREVDALAARRAWEERLEQAGVLEGHTVARARLWEAMVGSLLDSQVPPIPEGIASHEALLAALLFRKTLEGLVGQGPEGQQLLARADGLWSHWAQGHPAAAERLETAPDEVLDEWLNFADVGHFCLDEEGRIVHWGHSMERLYGVPSSEVIGHKLFEAFPAFQEEPEFQELLRKAIQTGRVQEGFRLRHRSKKMGIRYVDVRIGPVADSPAGRRTFRVLVHDVTEKQQSEKALDRYRQYVQTILQDAADAIIVLDEKDRIVMWNRGAEALYGWKAEEILGKPITVIVPNDPRSQREIEWISKEVQKRGYIRNWESQRITRDGRRVTINLTRTAIYDSEGRFVGSSIIARDVTEQKRLEQQLIQSEKLSAVGQLAAGIAHEVGSPLTAVSSLTQLLIERSDDEFFRERLTLIRKEVDRIARIVRELVDFSRPVTHSVERLNPNRLVEEAVHIVRYDRRLKHKQVDLELQPDVHPVEAGYDQLLQVLVNLLLNAADAIEAMDDGHVWVSTENRGDEVVLTVRDNGVGIPPENLPHIFDPFFTTKKPGKGTGLGLWVCFNVVRNLNGRIEVESEPGKGATFRVILPRCPLAVPRSTQEVSA